MSRRLAPLAALLLTLATPALSAPAAPAATPAHLRNVTLHIFNRVFTAFHDRVVAVPGREFRVGDTDYTARVVEFVPDFSMSLKTHRVTSRSGEPRNPAFRVVVSRAGTPTDTSWAFFNMPPHYAAREVLAFVATRIEFTNRPPLDSTDSLAIRIRQKEGEKR